jgi:prepilin-type processing-associated H-X9-DG protein
MIKLIDLLREYRSTKGVDVYLKQLQSEPDAEAIVLWLDGHVIVNGNAADTFKILKSHSGGHNRNVNLKIEPKKKEVRIYDYDDWSSFKTVPKFQQAIADLVRLKLIKPNYKIEIGLTDAKKILGKNDVKTFLNYDASYVDTIPRAFHGTTSKDLENIKRLGIVPPSKHDHEILKWDSFYTEDSPDKIYLSTDYDRARYYADHASRIYYEKGIKADPIVLQIDNLSTDRIVADDDFKSNMSMIQLLAAMSSGKKVDTDSYLTSIRSTSQFGYKGRIPWSMVTKTHYV